MAGENYIGSKISLISLSDIRYVGILHSINAQDSTVGLKQVRSFGTEGRRGFPSEEIPPSDNVFDYVVFRGSDIKDLQVFEAPPKATPPPPPPSLPQDPAIMSMGNYPVNNNYAYTPTNNASNYWKPQEQDQAQLEKETLDQLKSELEEADAMDEKAVDQLAKKVSELNTNEPEEKPKEEQQQQQQQQRRPRYEQRNRNRNQSSRQYNKNLVIPNSEFDFAASNAKFDKGTAEEDKEKEVEIPEPEEFYDKKSSFFDNISCESKERSEQPTESHRNYFQEERKLNMETFGQSTIDQSRYRNNNYRGRGRGNHRGGYYRYQNNKGYNNNGYNNTVKP